MAGPPRPYDLGQVWIRSPSSSTAADDAGLDAGPVGWIEVPWIHRERAPVPFADFTLRHTRRVLAQRGAEADQLAVAEALDALLTRAETGPHLDPDRASRKTSRRVAAKTHAATAGTDPSVSDAASAPLTVVDSAADELDDVDDDVGAEQPVGKVVPFGIFDAHAEARRFW